jgi:hypothetical protein
MPDEPQAWQFLPIASLTWSDILFGAEAPSDARHTSKFASSYRECLLQLRSRWFDDALQESVLGVSFLHIWADISVGSGTDKDGLLACLLSRSATGGLEAFILNRPSVPATTVNPS